LALTAQQLVYNACVVAKGPGYIVQAGQWLNMILGDLCQTFDFELAAKTYYGFFNPGLIAPVGASIYGSGPYPLPADFLRMKDDKAAIWSLLGVQYVMIPCDLSEFDILVQQADIQSYPYIIATDMSIADETAEGESTFPGFYVYSPPNGAYPFQIRYYSQMADIATPETSSTVPWFPNQGYLHKKLTAYVMGETGDSREGAWHKDADEMLTSYLKLKDNKSNRGQFVKLDRRQFSNNLTRLKNTKTVGWTLVLGVMLAGLARFHGIA
jgi:hypothetical protein